MKWGSFVQVKFGVSNLLLTSLLAGTDGPAEFSAGGLWARGEEGLVTKKKKKSQSSNPSSAFVSTAGHSTIVSMPLAALQFIAKYNYKIMNADSDRYSFHRTV